MKRIVSNLSVAKPFPLDGNVEAILPLPQVKEAQEISDPKKGWHTLKHYKTKKH